MKKLFGTLLAMGMLASPSIASEDPAITVCEAVLIEKLKAPKSYERVDAMVLHNTAVIRYDAVNEYNAPLRNTEVCFFEKRNDNGRFSISSRAIVNLTNRMNDLAAELNNLASAPDPARMEELTVQRNKLLLEVAGAVVRLKAEAAVADRTGVHPIDPNSTALKP